MIERYLIDQFNLKMNKESIELLKNIEYESDNKIKKQILNKIGIINNIMKNLELYIKSEEEPEKEEKPKKKSNKNFDIRDLKK